MQQSAHAGAIPLYRLSFKGTATLMAATQPWLKPCGRPCRRQDLPALLETLIAGDPVPLRPGRDQPRAIKRRPSPYPLLTKPRHAMKVIPHQKRYRKSAGHALS